MNRAMRVTLLIAAVAALGGSPQWAEGQDICMYCADDIVYQPGVGIVSWVHYFYGDELDEGGWECADANDEELATHFASSVQTDEDHDGCHIDDGPGFCGSHRACFGGTEAASELIRATTRWLRSASAHDIGPDVNNHLRAGASWNNFRLAADTRLVLEDCDGTELASWNIDEDVAGSVAATLATSRVLHPHRGEEVQGGL